MSDDLKRIYNHCDPYKPAADDFYLDCSAARGGGMLSQEFVRRLQLADDHLSFPHHHWQKLAELDLSENRFIPGGDPDYLAMLENLSVLEYINGGDDDPFAAAEPWYAVNPIVRELGQFKAARSGLCKVMSP